MFDSCREIDEANLENFLNFYPLFSINTAILASTYKMFSFFKKTALRSKRIVLSSGSLNSIFLSFFPAHIQAGTRQLRLNKGINLNLLEKPNLKKLALFVDGLKSKTFTLTPIKSPSTNHYLHKDYL